MAVGDFYILDPQGGANAWHVNAAGVTVAASILTGQLAVFNYVSEVSGQTVELGPQTTTTTAGEIGHGFPPASYAGSALRYVNNTNGNDYCDGACLTAAGKLAVVAGGDFSLRLINLDGSGYTVLTDGPADGTGNFVTPVEMAVTNSGVYYLVARISSGGHNKVVRYDSNTNTWTTTAFGGITDAYGLAVNRVTGDVFIGHGLASGFSVDQFNAAGTLIRTFRAVGSGGALFGSVDVGVSAAFDVGDDGDLYLAAYNPTHTVLYRVVPATSAVTLLATDWESGFAWNPSNDMRMAVVHSYGPPPPNGDPKIDLTGSMQALFRAGVTTLGVVSVDPDPLP